MVPMEVNFTKAIKKYNTEFKKVVEISPLVTLFERKNGKVYIAMTKKEKVIRYTEDGKWFERMAFKTPLLDMTLGDRVKLAGRLQRVYSNNTPKAIEVFLKINRTIAEWDKLKGI